MADDKTDSGKAVQNLLDLANMLEQYESCSVQDVVDTIRNSTETLENRIYELEEECNNRGKAITKLARWKGMDLSEVETEWSVNL